MHVKTNCIHFSWKKIELVNMNKIDQNKLWEPYCELNKLTRSLNCPDNCKGYDKKEK